MKKIRIRIENMPSKDQSHLEKRLSKGQPVLAQDTVKALEKFTDSQGHYLLTAQTAEAVEAMHRLASLEQSVQISRPSSRRSRSSPNPSSALHLPPAPTFSNLKPHQSLCQVKKLLTMLLLFHGKCETSGTATAKLQSFTDRFNNWSGRRSSLKELYKSDACPLNPLTLS